MKNKEIEELLNGMRDVSNTDGACMNLDRYLVKLLLSYIETLENRNKELYEGFMATQEELTDYATKNEQLEKLCNKYEQEHKTTIKIWKEDIKKSKQLEEELKEEQEENYKQSEWLVKKQKKIEQLENNRDKAIEYLEKSKLNQLDTYCKYLHIDFDSEKIENIDELVDILKGDSDYD